MIKTDSQLKQDVNDELLWESSVNATAIGIEVKEGVVTLAGHVASFAEKWDAERAAQRVAGVRALAIEIDVKLPGSSKRTDAEIAGAVESSLRWMTYSPKGAVKVMVEGGTVTLTGEVEWEFQKTAAAHMVRYLLGVTGVNNDITIKPNVSSTKIKSEIEAALKRRATADAKEIAVATQGSTVTLTGTVNSWSERNLATHSAWHTPGVKNVVDHLALAV
jgi:osmotically-inducible protein OsmY